MSAAPDNSPKSQPFWMNDPEQNGLFEDWASEEAIIGEVLRTDPRFGSIIDPRSAQDLPYTHELAAIKRFTERHRADPSFRQAVQENPQAAVEKYGIDINAQDMACFWDEETAAKLQQDPAWTPPLSVLRHRLFAKEKLLHRGQLRLEGCRPTDPNHRDWRDRQMKRGLAELGMPSYQGIIHAPFAIELSEGCSVGCWFCGVSADKKKGDFLYTPENAELWNNVLAVLRNKIGPAASGGFCYWATDPLDNPDYEEFCLDFAKHCGVFPQTTTAQAHKHVERVRRLLRLSNEHGCTINRFSILTLRAFNQIMDEFSAEELLHCEIVAQNFETETFQSSAGRAMNSKGMAKKKERLGVAQEVEIAPGTIACISGYLINMVKKQIRLITPCAASERWPDGYWILDEAAFTDGASFEKEIERMSQTHMRSGLNVDSPARVHPSLGLELTDDGFSVRGRDTTTTFNNSRPIGVALQAGNETLGELALRLEDHERIPAYETMATLGEVFNKGLLDEEPPSTQAK